MKRLRRTTQDIIRQRGAALTVTVIFFLFIALAILLGTGSALARDLRTAREFLQSQSSYYTAEAGNEDAFYRIKSSKQLSSSETITLNGGSASISIIDVGGNEKQIVSTGTVVQDVRKVRSSITTTTTGVDFFYGAQVGYGGIVMNNNARIEGAGGAAGNVYSNGQIVGGSGSTITGDAIVATGITEDNQARSTVCNQDQIAGQTNPQIDFAQSFSPGDSKPLSKVSLYVKKTGNPSSIPVRIVADSAGSPATTALANGTLDRNLVGSSYAWIDVTFSSPAMLTAGQLYWIVLDASQSSNNYWIWCRDQNNGFGNGVAKYKQTWSTSGTWTQITGDLAFKTFLGEGTSSITSVIIGGTAKANTITNSTISGDAYYQTISGSSIGGTSYPGSSDPPVLPMPISQANIDGWKSDATAGGTITGDCPGTTGCGAAMGPKKISGNLSVTNGATLTVTGTLYVTGNITIDNNATVQCFSGYGPNSCILFADGWIDVTNNVIFGGSGDPDSYIMLLSTIQGCNGGSQQPQCASGNSGINIENNADGAIFYTSDSMVNISNNATITSVVGYKLGLSNNAIIRYEIGIADLDFSSGPGGGWNVREWREIE